MTMYQWFILSVVLFAIGQLVGHADTRLGALIVLIANVLIIITGLLAVFT